MKLEEVRVLVFDELTQFYNEAKRLESIIPETDCKDLKDEKESLNELLESVDKHKEEIKDHELEDLVYLVEGIRLSRVIMNKFYDHVYAHIFTLAGLKTEHKPENTWVGPEGRA